MRVREETTIRAGFGREDIIEAIRELEQQYADGEMEAHAYFIKKRSLIKML